MYLKRDLPRNMPAVKRETCNEMYLVFKERLATKYIGYFKRDLPRNLSGI